MSDPTDAENAARQRIEAALSRHFDFEMDPDDLRDLDAYRDAVREAAVREAYAVFGDPASEAAADTTDVAEAAARRYPTAPTLGVQRNAYTTGYLDGRKAAVREQGERIETLEAALNEIAWASTGNSVVALRLRARLVMGLVPPDVTVTIKRMLTGEIHTAALAGTAAPGDGVQP